MEKYKYFCILFLSPTSAGKSSTENNLIATNTQNIGFELLSTYASLHEHLPYFSRKVKNINKAQKDLIDAADEFLKAAKLFPYSFYQVNAENEDDKSDALYFDMIDLQESEGEGSQRDGSEGEESTQF